MLQSFVGGQSIKPRFKLRFATELIELRERSHERLLRQVVGVLLTDHPHHQAKDAVRSSVVNLAERSAIAARTGLDRCIVDWLFVIALTAMLHLSDCTDTQGGY